MYRILSHVLNTRDHAFPGAPTLRLTPFEVIGENGSACNTCRVEVFNHYGTHMDGPNHFNPQGAELWQMPLETFISERPLLLDLPKGEGEGVTPEELLLHDEELKQADMLFIRSGFEQVRYTDNERYSKRGPCVSSLAAQLLVERWPNLKAVAMDWISLSSPLSLADGVRAHQLMLGLEGHKPILIIEDVSLQNIQPDKLKKVFVMPLLVEGIDSAPVTILAELED